MTKKEKIILTTITIIVLAFLTYLLIDKSLPSLNSFDPTIEDEEGNIPLSGDDDPQGFDNPGDPFKGEFSNDENHDPNEGLLLGAEGIASLPNVIFNVFGDVVEVGSSYVIINTSGQHMESGQSTQVTVYVVEDKFESTVIGPEEQIFIPGTNILDRNNNEISLKNLTSNMTISVESNENIKNETEFNASIIKIIE